MNQTSHNMLYEIQNYFPFQKARNEHGGGVALLIRDNIVSEQINLPVSVQVEELIGVYIKLEGKYYAIFYYYNPPQKTLNKKVFEYAE